MAGVTVNEGSGSATFTLTIPEVSDRVITLDYATEDASAVAGQDYTAKSGKVTIAPGETEQTVEIELNDDDRSEGLENFGLKFEQCCQCDRS